MFASEVAEKSVAVSLTGATDADKPVEKPKCKACCACPETKKARDSCIMENGEEKCSELIERHKQCMRDMGFRI